MDGGGRRHRVSKKQTMIGKLVVLANMCELLVESPLLPGLTCVDNIGDADR
jgi:hypothetical protein